MALEINNLHVAVDGIEIIKGVTLRFEPGKVYALMGPNGSGKSTLAQALTGHPKYKVTAGKIILDGKDITAEKPDIRAKGGLFLSFQYPAEISGVTISNFIRAAVNARRSEPLSVLDFHKLLQHKMAELKMDSSFSKRYVNAGFSGGEKKRAEILQLIMLQPRYAFLDETDSGLDVDAIKIVAEGINALRKKTSMTIIVITHYQRFLDYLEPDTVSIMGGGKIIASGGKELIQQIDEEGFEDLVEETP
ncbi:Fe-S cluster assembly ATPase SufC [Candidatus Woesearchaeota archaeon]|nr:Fe-S cluster assembly ATPase SufC [Candidatus Woesearchaeota archaeon]